MNMMTEKYYGPGVKEIYTDFVLLRKVISTLQVTGWMKDRIISFSALTSLIYVRSFAGVPSLYSLRLLTLLLLS